MGIHPMGRVHDAESQPKREVPDETEYLYKIFGLENKISRLLITRTNRRRRRTLQLCTEYVNLCREYVEHSKQYGWRAIEGISYNGR